jgi:chromosome segregation protein
MWQVNNMLEKDEKDIHNQVALSQKQFFSSSKELSELTTKLDNKNAELEKDSERLKSFNREFLIAEKKTKDAQDKVLLLRNKIPEMADGLDSLEKESKRTESELQALTAKKHDVTENIEKLKLHVQQAIDAIADIEAESQEELLSAIEKCDKEKARLSEEISDMLSQTSIEKEKVEGKLNDISLEFAKRVSERDHTKGLLAERKKVVAGLKGEIKLLEKRCSLIEEVIALEEQRNSLKTDVEKTEDEARTTKEKVEELKEALSEKEEKLNTLSSENLERKNSIASLEKEVGFYDELVLNVQDSENECSESSTLVEEARSGMKRLFIDNNRMLEELWSQ